MFGLLFYFLSLYIYPVQEIKRDTVSFGRYYSSASAVPWRGRLKTKATAGTIRTQIIENCSAGNDDRNRQGQEAGRF